MTPESRPGCVELRLSIDQITIDDHISPRESLDNTRVELFCELLRDSVQEVAPNGGDWTSPLPPIVVVPDGDGGYLLADGRHRYEAHRALGHGCETVRAIAIPLGGRRPADLAYELALTCATVSAKPLTRAEKRTALTRLIQERSELSDRAIARLVGVSNSTVSSWRKATCEPHTAATADDKYEPTRWEIAARRLAKDSAELMTHCRKLFGGPDFESAGRELYDALVELYGYDDADELLDELGAIVDGARVRAEKVA